MDNENFNGRYQYESDGEKETDFILNSKFIIRDLITTLQGISQEAVDYYENIQNETTKDLVACKFQDNGGNITFEEMKEVNEREILSNNNIEIP